MAAMAVPKDKTLQSDIAEILKDADLTTLSSKKIRKTLEDKYGIDLTDRKSVIDNMIMEQLALEQNRQTSAAQSKLSSNLVSSSSKENSRKRSENGDEDSGSNAGESDGDSDTCRNSPVRKKAKIEKKQTKRTTSDEESDKDSEVDDEDIARQLQEEEHKAVRKTRGSAKPSVEKKKTSRSKKEPGSGSSRKTNKYTEPCYLSPQLAAIMGEDRLKRSDVVKKMWAIVKERNLYDPRDKRFMICDDQMQSVFGCKKVQIFGMMKYLKHHITSPDDVA